MANLCFLLGVLLCGEAIAASIEDTAEYFPDDDGDDGFDGSAGKLNMVTTSPEKIEGRYHSIGGGGIHFLSEFLPESEVAELTIRTLEGELLITSLQNNHGLLLTVMGRQFLIINSSTTERLQLTGFVVPQEYSETVSQKLKTTQIPLKTLRNLDFEGGNATRQSAYEELLSRAEVGMIIDAAKMLGMSGVMGNENPSAFNFYILALRFAKFRSQEVPETETELEQQQQQRSKRSHCWWGRTHCSNNGRCCYSCPQGNDCLGLCGPGCGCWWWVCFNCCWNRFCHGHDLCCSGPNGYNTWGCLGAFQGLLNWATAGFTCHLPYWCYSDAPVF